MRRTALVCYLLVLLIAHPASAQDPAVPPDTEVQVQLLNGARLKGRLVSLSSSEVVIRRWADGPETKTRLSEVRHVETVHHNQRNLAIVGLAAGVTAGLLIDWCGSGSAYGSSGEPKCLTAMPALVAAGGAAAGALAGHAIDTRWKRTLFIAPGGLGSTRSGRALLIGASIRW